MIISNKGTFLNYATDFFLRLVLMFEFIWTIIANLIMIWPAVFMYLFNKSFRIKFRRLKKIYKDGKKSSELNITTKALNKLGFRWRPDPLNGKFD
jgi:hypothetical protein